MNLIKKIKFRLLRTEKPTRLQIITRLCAVLAVLSLIAMLVSFFIIEKNYKDSVRQDELVFPYTEYITVLTENLPLNIYESDDDNIKVNYLSDSTVSVYEEEGRLYIQQEGEFVITLFSKHQQNFHINLYLPRKSYRNIQITTTSAAVNCKRLDAHIIDINSRSGYFSADDISCTGNLTMNFFGANADINVSSFSKGNLVTEGGTINVSFAEKTDISVLTGSRCYINGIAVSGESTGDSKKRLKVSSPTGRVRITTG